jgi:hypothetical protein
VAQGDSCFYRQIDNSDADSLLQLILRSSNSSFLYYEQQGSFFLTDLGIIPAKRRNRPELYGPIFHLLIFLSLASPKNNSDCAP